MSRKMYITDDMGIDRGLTRISKSCTTCALIWPWLVPYFDDWGRAEADPERIKGKVFPLFPELTIEVIREAVYHLSSVGIITIYAHNNEWLMAVEPEKWYRYQTHIRAEKRENDKSQYPAPDNYDGGDYAEYRGIARDCAETRDVDVKIALPLGNSNGNTTVTVTPTLPRTKRATKVPEFFVPPTLEQFIKDGSLFEPPMPRDECERSWLHYEGVDWCRSNGKKLKDWKLALRSWYLNNKPGGRFHNPDTWSHSLNGHSNGSTPEQPRPKLRQLIIPEEILQWERTIQGRDWKTYADYPDYAESLTDREFHLLVPPNDEMIAMCGTEPKLLRMIGFSGLAKYKARMATYAAL